MPGVSSVRAADTATGLCPDPGSEEHGWLEVYSSEVPYSKRQVETLLSWGFTVAFNVAVRCAIAVALSVSTVGGDGAVVVKVWAEPTLVPAAIRN
ncbi:MAG TPA: hypothetical protein VED41_11080 [Solirubrobacteraceae bacterium]|nr:hypothetical protein [Solirubrobacteraceae bacterium]